MISVLGLIIGIARLKAVWLIWYKQEYYTLKQVKVILLNLVVIKL